MNMHTTIFAAFIAATVTLTSSTAFSQIEIDPSRTTGAAVRYFAWDLKG